MSESEETSDPYRTPCTVCEERAKSIAAIKPFSGEAGSSQPCEVCGYQFGGKIQHYTFDDGSNICSGNGQRLIVVRGTYEWRWKCWLPRKVLVGRMVEVCNEKVRHFHFRCESCGSRWKMRTGSEHA